MTETVEVSRDVESRLDELALLEDGWLDGEGDAISPLLIQLVRDKFHKPEGLPQPFVYPTPEGGITVEWVFSSEDNEGEDSWIEIEFSRVTYPSGVEGTEAFLSVENALERDKDVEKILNILAA